MPLLLAGDAASPDAAVSIARREVSRAATALHDAVSHAAGRQALCENAVLEWASAVKEAERGARELKQVLENYSAKAATSAESVAKATVVASSAETALTCASHAESWAITEQVKRLKATEAAGSTASQKMVEHGSAASGRAELHHFAASFQKSSAVDLMASISNATVKTVTSAERYLQNSSAGIAANSHRVDVLEASKSRAYERLTLASLERARVESAVTTTASVAKYRQHDAQNTMKAATWVRNAYAATIQEVLRAQSLQFTAENRLAAVRVDSRNVVQGARRWYEKTQMVLDVALAKHMAERQEASKVRIKQVQQASWTAADLWDKELERESMVSGLRERAFRHWQDMQQNYELARKTQDATTAHLEDQVQEMVHAAMARDLLSDSISARVASAVDTLLTAEEAEAMVVKEVKNAVASEHNLWDVVKAANEAVASATLASSQSRHAREIARVRAENDLDARNAAIMTLRLQKDRREACSEDLVRSNAALLTAERLSAEVEASVAKKAASASIAIAALGSVAHARMHVMTIASELQEAAEAVEGAEDILRKLEFCCSDSSLAVLKAAAKELKSLEAEAAAVAASSMAKHTALLLTTSCVSALRDCELAQYSLVLARRQHVAVISSAEKEDAITARRMRLAEAEFVAARLASDQASIDVANSSKEEAAACLHINAISNSKSEPDVSVARCTTSRHNSFIGGQRIYADLKTTSVGKLLSAKQRDVLTCLITNVCMRRAQETIITGANMSKNVNIRNATCNIH